MSKCLPMRTSLFFSVAAGTVSNGGVSLSPPAAATHFILARAHSSVSFRSEAMWKKPGCNLLSFLTAVVSISVVFVPSTAAAFVLPSASTMSRCAFRQGVCRHVHRTAVRLGLDSTRNRNFAHSYRGGRGRFFSTLYSSIHQQAKSPNSTTVSYYSTVATSNADLVQNRLAVARAKKQTRQLSLQQQEERNLYIRDLIHNSTFNSTYPVPPLYAVKISVCPVLRDELKLNGREKRGRLFIETSSQASQSLSAFKQELHSFFRALKRSTYILEASLPNSTDEDNGESWPINSTEDILKTFQRANEYFEEHSNNGVNDDNNVLKRPTVLVYVSKDPNAPKIEIPPYLQNLPDPSKSTHVTMLSFYAFGELDHADDFALELKRAFRPFQALGRIYVAPSEGVNAQMSVPTNVLPEFIQCCHSIPFLHQNMENGVNVDPKPILKQVFDENPPFSNLHIRVRTKIVADGLDQSLNWQSAGYDMPPLEWHETLQNSDSILLDCRNTYESQVGRFDKSEPLNTTTFKETWDALQKRLKDTPKDAPIMTYCTGGIRCVKVGAYLTQEMGFTNVSRLAGGIVAYDRTLQEEAPDTIPLFKGTNFVFDGRLGRQVTDDKLAECITCGSKTDLVSNCLNNNCHLRMVQCETCRTKYHGTCSQACKQRILKDNSNNNAMMLSKRKHDTVQKDDSKIQPEQLSYNTLEEYSLGHSTRTEPFFAEMEFNTQAHLPSGSHMVSGAAQGQLLKMLASMTREGRVLELGTFSGYATACLIEGAANVFAESTAGSHHQGPFVMTLERDGRAMDLAVAHLEIMTRYNGVGPEAAKAASQLRQKGVPQVNDDIVSFTYKNKVGVEIVRVTDALAALEEMAAAGNDKIQQQPFDMVFVDADKTRLLEYVEACLANDNVLKKGGLIVVDNVLWKGLVLEASQNNSSISGSRESISVSNGGNENPNSAESKRGRRARKLANKMHRFNSAIVKDDRVEVMVLPMRDGLSVIRKR